MVFGLKMLGPRDRDNIIMKTAYVLSWRRCDVTLTYMSPRALITGELELIDFDTLLLGNRRHPRIPSCLKRR
jgi:hypothetical protein